MLRAHPGRLSSAFKDIHHFMYAFKFTSNASQIFLAVLGLDVDGICSSFQIQFAAPKRIIQSVWFSGIGARDDKDRVLARPGCGCRTYFLGHLVRWGNLFAGHVTAPLGWLLILDEDGGDTHRVVDVDRVGHVLDVAIAVIAVHQYRQTGGTDDLAHGFRLLAEAD